MGMIAVETRAVEVVIPADPGNPESDTKVGNYDFFVLFLKRPLVVGTLTLVNLLCVCCRLSRRQVKYGTQTPLLKRLKPSMISTKSSCH